MRKPTSHWLIVAAPEFDRGARLPRIPVHEPNNDRLTPRALGILRCRPQALEAEARRGAPAGAAVPPMHLAHGQDLVRATDGAAPVQLPHGRGARARVAARRCGAARAPAPKGGCVSASCCAPLPRPRERLDRIHADGPD